jgi:hypothetical protein
MRRVAILAACIGFALPATAHAGERVSIVPGAVLVSKPGQVDVKVRCRTSRTCRGTLRLSVRCDTEDQPAIEANCRVPVGLAEFAIPRGKVRAVRVARLPIRFTSGSAGTATVDAEAFIDRRGGSRRGSFRRLLLVAVPALARPPFRAELHDVDAARADDPAAYAVRFEVDAPLRALSVTATVRGRSVELHEAAPGAYVVPADSWVPGGVVFHGELQVGRDELPPRSRQVIRLETCTFFGCGTDVARVTIPDPDDVGPICVIGPREMLPSQ